MLLSYFLGWWCFSGGYVWVANCCLGRNNNRRGPYHYRRRFQFLHWWCAAWRLRGFSWFLGFWCPKCSWRPVRKLGTTKWLSNREPPIGHARYQGMLDVWKIFWWDPGAIGVYHCGWESNCVKGMDWQYVAHWTGPSLRTLFVDMEGAKNVANIFARRPSNIGNPSWMKMGPLLCTIWGWNISMPTTPMIRSICPGWRTIVWCWVEGWLQQADTMQIWIFQCIARLACSTSTRSRTFHQKTFIFWDCQNASTWTSCVEIFKTTTVVEHA